MRMSPTYPHIAARGIFETCVRRFLHPQSHFLHNAEGMLISVEHAWFWREVPSQAHRCGGYGLKNGYNPRGADVIGGVLRLRGGSGAASENHCTTVHTIRRPHCPHSGLSKTIHADYSRVTTTEIGRAVLVQSEPEKKPRETRR